MPCLLFHTVQWRVYCSILSSGVSTVPYCPVACLLFHTVQCRVYCSILSSAVSTVPYCPVACLLFHTVQCRVYCSILSSALSTVPYCLLPCLLFHTVQCRAYCPVSTYQVTDLILLRYLAYLAEFWYGEYLIVPSFGLALDILARLRLAKTRTMARPNWSDMPPKPVHVDRFYPLNLPWGASNTSCYNALKFLDRSFSTNTVFGEHFLSWTLAKKRTKTKAETKM